MLHFLWDGPHHWKILDLAPGTQQETRAEGTIEISGGERVTLNDRGNVDVLDEPSEQQAVTGEP